MKSSHHNVVSYHFAMITDGELRIGMELMDSNLRELLKKKEKKSDIFWIDVMYQVAKAMCYLHDMYVVHRDLKPSNILINVIDTIVMDKLFNMLL